MQFNLNITKNLFKWTLFKFLHPLYKKLPKTGHKKNILMVCNGTQMVEHLSEIWELLKYDQNLRFYLFLPHSDSTQGMYQRISSKLDIRIISRLKLLLKRWDLVILPDHLHYISRWNLFTWPTLRIPHGVVGKSVEGESYYFGKPCLNSNGEIPYTRIIVYSEAEMRLAITTNPSFKNKVVVTGNLKSDSLLKKSKNRDKIKTQLGLQQNEKLILIVSTFGENCLFNTIGEVLLSKAISLSTQFRFAISIHPFEHSKRMSGDNKWLEYLSNLRSQGFLVLAPTEDWESYMLACDILLTDHTSLSLYGLPLGKSFIYVPIPEDSIEKNSITWGLMNISPMLSADASNLEDCINEANSNICKDRLKDLSDKFCTYAGEATDRTKTAIYDILNN